LECGVKIEVLDSKDGVRLVWYEEGTREIGVGVAAIVVVPLAVFVWWRGGLRGFDEPELFFYGMLLVAALGVGALFVVNAKWEVRITGEAIHVVPRSDGKVEWKDVEGFAWAAHPLGDGEDGEGRGLYVYTAARRIQIAPAVSEAEAREMLARIAKRLPMLARKCEIRQLL
jgi:hypothetical protein